MGNKKVGYTFAFHHSDKIRPNGKIVLEKSLESLYNSCTHDFEVFAIDNQSDPRSSFNEIFDTSLPKYKNLNHTYVENQFLTGLTGAWNRGIKEAIDAGCDVIILSGDDIITDLSFNKMVDYILNDPQSDNTVYGPVAGGIGNIPIQNFPHPTGRNVEVSGKVWGQHLGGHMYAFTKELYHKKSLPNGDLFSIEHPHNGGDGKWGGNEGQIMTWAEQGIRCVVVGDCWVNHLNMTDRSYRDARELDSWWKNKKK
tara:strand:- start:508 stop:1269 length:762 start_codon:yes stop_codon:yes gene_type:complete